MASTIACAGPQVSNNAFSCATLTLNDAYGSTGNCTTWSGSGTSASPFQCSSWGNFTNGETISSVTSTVNTTTNSTGSDTVQCSSPSIGSPFSCNLALASNGSTGSCNTWSGSGSSISPYYCSNFGAFTGGSTISSSTNGTATSANLTGSSTVTCTNPAVGTSGLYSCTLTLGGSSTVACSPTGKGTSSSPFACATPVSFSGGQTVSGWTGSKTTGSLTSVSLSVTGCSYSSSHIVCTLPNGDTAQCKTVSSTSPHYCTAFNNGSGGETFANNPGYSSSTTSGSYSYYQNYTLTWTNATYYSSYGSNSYSATIYYVPSYTVNDSTSYTYVSTYNVNYAYPTTYAVRVKVCDPTIGVESNCVQYGTNYKPQGVIQNNSQNMRFGAFSYFNSVNTDNAVMRSKAKYVGPTMYTPSNGAVANSRAEYSSVDGTLIFNPDSDMASASYPAAVSNSGVINYINQFGSFASTYKTYDDVGKLYYETLKYLRGLQPTTAFYNGTTSTSADGFPIITSWDDPYKDNTSQATPYSCRKSYIMLMGDAHTWCDKKLPGGSYTSSQDISTCSGTGYGPDYGSLSGDTGVNVTTSTNAIGTQEGLGALAAAFL